MVFMQNNYQALHLPTIGQETRERTKKNELIFCRWTYRIYPTAAHLPFEDIPDE